MLTSEQMRRKSAPKGSRALRSAILSALFAGAVVEAAHFGSLKVGQNTISCETVAGNDVIRFSTPASATPQALGDLGVNSAGVPLCFTSAAKQVIVQGGQAFGAGATIGASDNFSTTVQGNGHPIAAFSPALNGFMQLTAQAGGPNTLTLAANLNSSGQASIDSAQALLIAPTSAPSVSIGRTGGEVVVQAGSSVAITGTVDSNFTVTGANLTLSTVTTGNVVVSAAGTGSLTAGAGLTITGGAASTWKTSAGALTVDSAANLNLGTVVATGVTIGQTGIAVSVPCEFLQNTGPFSVIANGVGASITTNAGNTVIDSIAIVHIGNTNATSVQIGRAAGNVVVVSGRSTPTGFVEAFALSVVNNGASNGSGGIAISAGNTGGTGANFVEMRDPANNVCGTIEQNGGAGVLYNVTSDARLKDVVGPIPNALARIGLIDTVEYRRKDDASGRILSGCLAQNVMEWYPDAVSVPAVGDDPANHPYQMDYGKLSPLALAGIKELVAENRELRARILRLEEKVG